VVKAYNKTKNIKLLNIIGDIFLSDALNILPQTNDLVKMVFDAYNAENSAMEDTVILEALVGMVQGCDESVAGQEGYDTLKPHIQKMIDTIISIINKHNLETDPNDEPLIESVCGLLGDLARTRKTDEERQIVRNPNIIRFITIYRHLASVQYAGVYFA